MISTIGPDKPVELPPEIKARNAAILERLQADEDAIRQECQRIQEAARKRDRKRRKTRWQHDPQ